MILRKRGIFNSKKALQKDLFFNIFELLLALIVIFALLKFINDVTSQTLFEKNYLARDISLTINALYSAPGSMTYTYSENVNNLILDMKDNKVEIYKKDDPDSVPHVFYLFAEDKNYPLEYGSFSFENEPITLQFSKTGKELQIDSPSAIK